MDDRTTPRIGIVGAGDFGAQHAHAYRRAGARVLGVVDPDHSRAAALAHEVGASPFASLDELLAHHPVDGVSIAANGAAHPRLVEHCVRAGVRVLVEKPVGPTAAAVQGIRDLPEAEDLVVPAHVLRFDTAHRALCEALPRVGTLHSISAHRNRENGHAVAYPHEHPALLTMVHDIDLCLWLTGSRFASVAASSRGSRTPSGSDVLLAQAELENGVLCELRSAWILPTGSPERDRLELLGQDGMAVLERQGEDVTVTVLVGEDVLTEHHRFEPLDREIAEMTGWLRGGPRPAVRLDEAQHGLRVAEAVIRSAAVGGTVQRIPSNL
jgi:predicted dehydrogenase